MDDQRKRAPVGRGAEEAATDASDYIPPHIAETIWKWCAALNNPTGRGAVRVSGAGGKNGRN